MIQSMTLIGFIFDMVGALLLSVDITSLSRIDILRSGSMQIGSISAREYWIGKRPTEASRGESRSNRSLGASRADRVFQLHRDPNDGRQRHRH